MKRPVTYMAKEELFHNKIFGAFIRFLGAFPVKRGAGDMQVIDDCVDILESGRNVVIFPEGTRSKETKWAEERQALRSSPQSREQTFFPWALFLKAPSFISGAR